MRQRASNIDACNAIGECSEWQCRQTPNHSSNFASPAAGSNQLTFVLVRIDGTELGSVHQNEAQTARETWKKLHFPVEIGNQSKKFSRASAGFTEAPVRARPTSSQPR
jgi:hypothetical protein